MPLVTLYKNGNTINSLKLDKADKDKGDKEWYKDSNGQSYHVGFYSLPRHYQKKRMLNEIKNIITCLLFVPDTKNRMLFFISDLKKNFSFNVKSDEYTKERLIFKACHTDFEKFQKCCAQYSLPELPSKILAVQKEKYIFGFERQFYVELSVAMGNIYRLWMGKHQPKYYYGKRYFENGKIQDVRSYSPQL